MASNDNWEMEYEEERRRMAPPQQSAAPANSGAAAPGRAAHVDEDVSSRRKREEAEAEAMYAAYRSALGHTEQQAQCAQQGPSVGGATTSAGDAVAPLAMAPLP